MRFPIFRTRTALLVLTGAVAAGSAIVPATSAFAARVSYVAPADNAALTHKVTGTGTGGLNRPLNGLFMAATEPLAVQLNCTFTGSTYYRYHCTATASGGSGNGYSFYWSGAEEVSVEGASSDAYTCAYDVWDVPPPYVAVDVAVVDSNSNVAHASAIVHCQ
jgi:hypothetical protein